MASPRHLLLLYLLLTTTVAAALQPPPPTSTLLHHHTIRGAPFPSTSSTTKIIDPTHPWDLPSQHDLTPNCSLPLLLFNLSSTSLAVFSSNYTPPDPDRCPWTRASLHVSAYAEGAGSPDRIASVWLGGVELLRTATPVPTGAGVLWSVRKDVTRYSAALSHDGVASMALQGISSDADAGSSGSVNVSVTLDLYVDAPRARSVVGRKPKAGASAVEQPERLHLLYGKPADMIIPLSSRTPEEEEDCFWYRVRGEADEFMDAVSIPNNTRRAVLEMYVSGHAVEEFWYANLPNYFFFKGRDGGPLRQVSATVDGLHVGTWVPFPAVYSGGVNPLLWTPVAPVESFVLPSHDIELTPMLGRLLDGEPHAFVIGIAGALPFWLVGANLHLWLDPDATAVSAGLTRYEPPGFGYSTKTKWGPSWWKFQAGRKGELRLSGWVASSLGNLTTEVKEEVEVEGKVSLRTDGVDVEEVELEAEYERKVEVVEGMRNVLANLKQKTKFPLEITAAVAAVGNGTCSRSDVKVSRGLEETVKVTYGRAKRKRKVKNKEEGEGWMVVEEGKGGAVVSGSATMEHKYYERSPRVGHYERKVKVRDGVVVEDRVDSKTRSNHSDM